MKVRRISSIFIALLLCAALATGQNPATTGIALAQYPFLAQPSDTLANGSWGKSVQVIQAVVQPNGAVMVMAKTGNTITYSWNSQPPPQDSLKLFSMRFTPQGQLDTTYGQRGWVRYYLPYRTPPENIQAVLQPDGKWVVAHDFSDNQDIAIMRFEPDGRLDPTFREAGYGLHSSQGSTDDDLNGLSILPDGKIQIIFFSRYETLFQGATVARFTSDGRMDTSFRHGGILRFAERAWIGDCRMLPDGRFVLVCYDNDFIKIERYLPDGSVDWNYGRDGFVTTHIQSINGDYWSLMSDGSLTVFGYESLLCETGKPDTEFRLRYFDANGRQGDYFNIKTETSQASVQYPAIMNTSPANDRGQRAFLVNFDGGQTLNFYDQNGQLLSKNLSITGLFEYSCAAILPSPQGSFFIIGNNGELIVVAQAWPEGRLNTQYGMDSAAIARFNYQLLTNTIDSITHYELEDVDPASASPYTLVESDLDSTHYTELIIDFETPRWHFDGKTLKECRSLVEAIDAGKSHPYLHLRLSNGVFPGEDAAWTLIPAEKLLGLSLSNCSFEGPAPTELQRFKNLERLEITYNQYQTDIEPALSLIRSFPNLRCLVIKTPGKVELPRSFNKLRNLESLFLDMPDLLQFPEGITSMKKLKELRLVFICPEGLPSSLGLLDSLQLLELTGVQAQSRLQLPETIDQLSQLKTLKLAYGGQDVELPATIGKLKALKTFSAEQAGIRMLPESFGNCSKLTELTIITSGHFDSLPDACIQLPNLTQITLDICQPDTKLRWQGEKLKALCNSRNGSIYVRLF